MGFEEVFGIRLRSKLLEVSEHNGNWFALPSLSRPGHCAWAEVAEKIERLAELGEQSEAGTRK